MFGQVKSETEDKGLRMIEQITRKETSWMNDQENIATGLGSVSNKEELVLDQARQEDHSKFDPNNGSKINYK